MRCASSQQCVFCDSSSLASYTASHPKYCRNKVDVPHFARPLFVLARAAHGTVVGAAQLQRELKTPACRERYWWQVH
jgi:hypothetical protein